VRSALRACSLEGGWEGQGHTHLEEPVLQEREALRLLLVHARRVSRRGGGGVVALAFVVEGAHPLQERGRARLRHLRTAPRQAVSARALLKKRRRRRRR
jgi:hypothetical protein